MNTISTRCLVSVALTVLLSACSTLDKLPFIGDDSPGVRQPKDATRYDCKNGKSFYVRRLDKENAMWVIYPDREVRFEKAGDKSAQKYVNGSAVLELSDSQASITDGTDTSLADCKVPAK